MSEPVQAEAGQEASPQIESIAPAERRQLDAGVKKNIFIIGGVLVVAIAAMTLILLMNPAQQQGPAGASVPHSAPAGQEKSEPVNPVMAQLLREQQLAEAEAARRAGRPYIPPDSMALEPIPASASAGYRVSGYPYGADVAPGAGMRGSQLGSAGLPGAQGAQVGITPDEQARLERMRAGVAVQLRELAGAAAPAQSQARVVISEAQSAGGSAAVVARAPSAAAPAAPVAVVVEPLEIFSAITLTPVDTYKTGYFSARIVSGRLAGAMLVGRTQVVNEGLQPRLTQMRWGSKTYAVDAVVLDEKSGADAVEANLDRRYMQRYLMPIVVAMAGGYASAKAQTGSEAVALGSAGGVSVTQPPPTDKQAINAGVAAGMSILQRAVDREAALPIRATLPAGTGVGVMFNAAVIGDIGAANPVQPSAASDRAEGSPNVRVPVPAAEFGAPMSMPNSRITASEGSVNPVR